MDIEEDVVIGLRFEKESDVMYRVKENSIDGFVGSIYSKDNMWFFNNRIGYTVLHLSWLKQIVEFMEKLS